MKDLSIVVPAYNVERFLAVCLDSIIQTDWATLRYEVIIVDDASPDNSLAIATRYSEMHPQIKIVSQENRGLGGARNTGLGLCSGSYVFFLDSDDYLVHNKLPELVLMAKEANADIYEFSAQTVSEEYKLISNIFPVKHCTGISGSTYYGSYEPSNSVCNKLYRRAFLLKNSLLFLERVYVEDAPFNLEAYLKAASVGSFPHIPVAFMQNTTSITRQRRTGEQMAKFIKDSITVTKRMHGFLKSGAVPSDAQRAVEKKIAVFVSGILLMIFRDGEPFPTKLKYLTVLKNNNLYPMKYRSGIISRDMFLRFCNIKPLFSVMMRLKSKGR